MPDLQTNVIVFLLKTKKLCLINALDKYNDIIFYNFVFFRIRFCKHISIKIITKRI